LWESPAHFAFELKPNQEQVSNQGSPDLVQPSIRTGPVKGFNSQLLLDPLEKEFDLPAPAAEFGQLGGPLFNRLTAFQFMHLLDPEAPLTTL
jgi:hypothetical protein